MSLDYNISNISFLVIDDCKPMRLIVRTMLSRFGVRKVIEVPDAVQALETLKTNSIDLIIVDRQMDLLDGNEFVRLVRTAADSPNPFVPIIMLTAYTEHKYVTKARDAGITESLCKPVSARDLYLRVIETLDNPRKFIRSPSYFGPDRRRTAKDEHQGSDGCKSPPGANYSGPDRRAANNEYKGPERRRHVVQV